MRSHKRYVEGNLMSRAVDARIADLLEEAADKGVCYVPRGDDVDAVRRALSRRVSSGAAVSPVRGLFADAREWSSLASSERALWIARGLQVAHPTWTFCGPTAALAYGVDVSDTLVGRTHVATLPKQCGSDGGVVARHPVLDPREGVEEVGGLRVTSPQQTVLDCLRWTDFPRGLGIIDSALRTGLVGKDAFEDYAQSMMARRRNVERALSDLAWADPRSENGGESIARGRMLLLGYVRPELQVEVPRVVEAGEPYRADFCWVRADGRVILGELDGRGKYVEEELMGGRDIDEVLSDENIRGSRFTLYDVSLVRFSFGLTGRPMEFAALLDEYGVPKRGSAIALPEGTRMIPDWDALRRSNV